MCSLSSSYLTHIDRLTSARNCVSLGLPEAWVLAWGVARLMGGDSGLTSPLGSVLSQCTVRYHHSFAVPGIPGGTAARTSSRDRYNDSVHSLVQID